MPPAGRTVLAGALVVAVLSVALAGCGDDEDGGPPPAPAGGFAEALHEVSTGPIPVGVGFGYVDLAALGGADADWAAGALGPGGSILLTKSERIARRTGFDPGGAERLLSVAASYTLGVRADGVATKPIARALRPAAQRRAREGEWELLDLGTEWSVPNGTPAEVLSGMGARIALGPDAAVAARTNRARTELTTPSDEVLTDPAVRLSLACLGDPVAARIVPNNFTHAPNSGPDLLAFGVSDPADGPVTETFCAADPDAALIDEAATAVADRLVPASRDEVTGERIGDTFTDASFDRLEADGAHAAQAKLTLAAGEAPGFLFDAFVHGSLITYVGLAPPRAN